MGEPTTVRATVVHAFAPDELQADALGPSARGQVQARPTERFADELTTSESARVDARLRDILAELDPIARRPKANLPTAVLEKPHHDVAAMRWERIGNRFIVCRSCIDMPLARLMTNIDTVTSQRSIYRSTSRNVKRWLSDKEMCWRCCASGMHDAEREFGRFRGHERCAT